jgi:hypothetical protein
LRKSVIPKNQFSEGEIQAHKESCPNCIQARQERKKEEELRLEGPLQMKYTICAIRAAKDDIDLAKRKIQKEREEKLENWDWAIKDIEGRFLDPAKYRLKK